MDLPAPPSYPTLDAAPVLSAAQKAALVHAYASQAHAREVRAEWLADCERHRRADRDAVIDWDRDIAPV